MKITFKQFQQSRVFLPWFVHCQLWGVDTENEDINKRVYSYMNGLFINVDINGNFHVEFDRSDISDDDLATLEQTFWDEFVNREINSDRVDTLKIALNEIIEDHFGKIYEEAHELTKTKSGDISPDEMENLDNITKRFLILLNTVLRNNL